LPVGKGYQFANGGSYGGENKAADRCPCEVAPQGWYTGTPYGPVDLLPVEGNWQDYRVIIFLGWHTYLPEDGVKMLEFVKSGGTLLLTRRHLSSSLIHNGEAQYADDPALKELLGDWQHASRCVTRQIGKGEVIFFADDNFPAADGLREKYIAAMQTAAEKATAAEAAHLWAKGSEDVNFAVYEQPNGERTIYALNINWWEHKTGNLEIICGNQSRTQEIPAVELMQI
jgi:hypothetical protein